MTNSEAETTATPNGAQRRVDTSTILGDEEREEITRLFGYVPEPEPLEQMLAAVEQIVTARLFAAAEAIETDRYVRTSSSTYGQGYYDGHSDGRQEAARIVRDLAGGGR